MYNPALREQRRDQPATVIPPQKDASILDWLERTGRLLARDSQDFDYRDDEAEITALMAAEDPAYEEEDDDELDLED